MKLSTHPKPDTKKLKYVFLNFGFILLRADLTDSEMGICDDKYKPRYENLNTGELSMIKLLVAISNRVSVDSLKNSSEVIQPAIEEIKKTRVQRLYLALLLIHHHFDSNKVKDQLFTEVIKLIAFLENQMDGLEGEDEDMRGTAKSTLRVAKMFDIFMRSGIVLDTSLSPVEWYRAVGTITNKLAKTKRESKKAWRRRGKSRSL